MQAISVLHPSVFRRRGIILSVGFGEVEAGYLLEASMFGLFADEDRVFCIRLRKRLVDLIKEESDESWRWKNLRDPTMGYPGVGSLFERGSGSGRYAADICNTERVAARDDYGRAGLGGEARAL
jgi:hypothetical protein